MAHVSTTESYIRKVCRIAKELDITIEEAAVTCDAFELAFSDQETRRAIFEMIDQLDGSAAKKGEPLGLIITYAVEVGPDGIHVGRYADYVPLGQSVELTPANQAMIFLRLTDDFPTHEVLGPMIVNRLELPSLDRRSTGQPRRPERAVATISADGMVCSDKDRSSVETHAEQDGLNYCDTTQPELPTELPSHWPSTAIPRGPVRLKFNERFPCVSPVKPSSPSGSTGFPVTCDLSPVTSNLPLVTCHSSPAASGLSPPFAFGELGHSETKDVHRPLANRSRDMRLTPGSLKSNRRAEARFEGGESCSTCVSV